MCVVRVDPRVVLLVICSRWRRDTPSKRRYEAKSLMVRPTTRPKIYGKAVPT